MPDVLMPRLSESMEEGTILRWLSSDGDTISAGAELVEIETDKATEAYAAPGGGVLGIVAAVGETLPVGAVIARLAHAADPVAPVLAAPLPAARTGGAKGDVTALEPTRGEGLVARRIAESRATIPSFEVSVVCDAGTLPADPCAAVLRACGRALREHPRLNAAYRDARFELFARVNIAVSTGASAVPTLFDADVRARADLAEDIDRLIARADAGVLTPPEVAGATFTVAFAPADAFSAVVTPGQAAALAVGAVREAPVVREGTIRAGRVLTLTLSVDGRIVTATAAAGFLARARELLEAGPTA